MKKVVNIFTYCTWSSIGSILQAYGLYHTLERHGCECSLLLESWNKIYTNEKVNSLKNLIKSIFDCFHSKKKKARYEKRIKFINDTLKVEYIDDYNDFCLKVKEEDGSICLAGSDQIWHPEKCNPVYFLDFVENKKCVSYAASMGNIYIRPEKKNLFQRLINNFDFISVREEDCAEIIKEMTEKDVEVHIDPTFLISVDEWRALSVSCKIKEPYILLYMLYWDKSCKEKIKKLKKETGLKVYAIADELSRVYADKVLYDVGIEEFLWLIDHAEYFITSSFHGTAFASIFNKKFSAIINPASPSRIMNLMMKLSLPIVEIEDLTKTNLFDYELTNRLIQFEKEKSIEYLKRVIG